MFNCANLSVTFTCQCKFKCGKKSHPLSPMLNSDWANGRRVCWNRKLFTVWKMHSGVHCRTTILSFHKSHISITSLNIGMYFLVRASLVSCSNVRPLCRFVTKIKKQKNRSPCELNLLCQNIVTNHRRALSYRHIPLIYAVSCRILFVFIRNCSRIREAGL